MTGKKVLFVGGPIDGQHRYVGNDSYLYVRPTSFCRLSTVPSNVEHALTSEFRYRIVAIMGVMFALGEDLERIGEHKGLNYYEVLLRRLVQGYHGGDDV